MRIKFTVLCLISLGAAAGGAIANGQAKQARIEPRSNDLEVSHGREFARTHCAGCHAIDAGISPKPEAPSFGAVINTPGLSDATLKPWLRDSHNYPEIMKVEIAADQIDALAVYMLTLKDPAYRQPIQ